MHVSERALGPIGSLLDELGWEARSPPSQQGPAVWRAGQG